MKVLEMARNEGEEQERIILQTAREIAELKEKMLNEKMKAQGIIKHDQPPRNRNKPRRRKKRRNRR